MPNLSPGYDYRFSVQAYNGERRGVNAACTYKLPPLRKVAPCADSSTLENPVGNALGDTHRTPSEPCADAA